MILKDILETTQKVTGLVNPLLASGIGLINSFLPDEEKIPLDSTGEQVFEKMQSLPASARASLLEKNIDLEIKEADVWLKIQEAHSKTDAAGNSLRPEIANRMSWLVIAAIFPMTVAINYSIFKSDAPLAEIENLSLLMGTLITIPSTIVLGYFGLRTTEKKARYSASVGQSVNPVGVLGAIFGGRK